MFFYLAFFSNVSVSTEQNEIYEKIQNLEEQFKSLSSDFYKDKKLYSDKVLIKIKNIDHLYSSLNNFVQQEKISIAIQVIHKNTELLENNFDNKAFFYSLEILLRVNEWTLAKQFYEILQSEGEKSLLSSAHYIFAKHHAKRHEWKEVVDLLDNTYNDLSAEDSAYAYLMTGAALQHLKKHRQASDYYQKIPTTSQYYIHAQLNSAVANIRQGWWTDAQTAINSLIKQTNKTNQDELINRLYIVLGYALLQREYYRDARDAFREVGLNSRYTNRALLGIGLTATSQGDYVGGLNALSVLKEKKAHDLSVDESYLLIPYVYEKLQQELTVTASYSEAMNYYQNRIDTLDTLVQLKHPFDINAYDKETGYLSIADNKLDYDKHYPASFIENFQNLKRYQNIVQNSDMKKSINKLAESYQAVYGNIVSNLILRRQNHLKSYLNQARYGLARLYDSSNESTEK